MNNNRLGYEYRLSLHFNLAVGMPAQFSPCGVTSWSSKSILCRPRREQLEQFPNWPTEARATPLAANERLKRLRRKYLAY